MDNDTVDIAQHAAHLAARPSVEVMGVNYLHLQLDDGSDLYLTEFGLPFNRHLLPDNHWADKQWLAKNRVTLQGTSKVHKVRTKQVDGMSKDVVIKWNRMGQDIPGETQASDLEGAKFNSPFEEFSLVIELRNSARDLPLNILTHRPLGIYVPRKFVDPSRIGRRKHLLDAIQEDHSEIKIDANRNYAVIYEWIKGIDASQALRKGMIDKEGLRELMVRSNDEMRSKGFWVRDNKPHHVIVRPTPDGHLARDRSGRPLYAMIDFELLERTAEHDMATRATRRKAYLFKQAHRFDVNVDFPPGLSPVNILGVDYVYGQVESTGGRLWVVGKDPALFEYFLPEKWRRTPSKILSKAPKTYDTITKDSIHLVWRTSRVGRKPQADASDANAPIALDYGYNSPFEEVCLSMELAGRGIDTSYPRAVYMTGSRRKIPGELVDDSRYLSHQLSMTADGHGILSMKHDHMIIWGHWNGPDELLVTVNEDIYVPVDALAALKQGMIDSDGYAALMQTTRRRLKNVGIDAIDMRGDHLLLSLDKSGGLVTNDEGMPTVRICNFELMRHVGEISPPIVTTCGA